MSQLWQARDEGQAQSRPGFQSLTRLFLKGTTEQKQEQEHFRGPRGRQSAASRKPLLPPLSHLKRVTTGTLAIHVLICQKCCMKFPKNKYIVFKKSLSLEQKEIKLRGGVKAQTSGRCIGRRQPQTGELPCSPLTAAVLLRLVF